MTAAQEKYVGRLFDSCQYTEAQRVAVLRYMGSRAIDALAPPKDTPTAERDALTHSKGRRLLNAMSDFKAAGEPCADEALAFLRSDDECADWTGLDTAESVNADAELPWTDRANELRTQRRSDEDEARRQAWEAVN